jgi:hypothetical protein
MVKNSGGGNKTKKQARKNVAPVDESSIKARFSTDPDEIYACCAKLLGNGTCRVMCIDGKERHCIIRNKFRGRGRRGNVLNTGTWCLVGRRDFEKIQEGKLEKTDLLEVYGDIEKKLIIQKEVGLKDKWKIFTSIGGMVTETKEDDVVNFNQGYKSTPNKKVVEPVVYIPDSEFNSDFEEDEDTISTSGAGTGTSGAGASASGAGTSTSASGAGTSASGAGTGASGSGSGASDSEDTEYENEDVANNYSYSYSATTKADEINIDDI